MTTPVKIEDGKMYGHRARIGYTSPPLTTEIFPYEFYKIVPDGVSLVVTSLDIIWKMSGKTLMLTWPRGTLLTSSSSSR